MELITILNSCHRFRGFVYQHAHFSADKKSIEVAVRPRKGSAAVCSRCHLPAPGYDQLAERILLTNHKGGRTDTSQAPREQQRDVQAETSGSDQDGGMLIHHRLLSSRQKERRASPRSG